MDLSGFQRMYKRVWWGPFGGSWIWDSVKHKTRWLVASLVYGKKWGQIRKRKFRIHNDSWILGMGKASREELSKGNLKGKDDKNWIYGNITFKSDYH